VAPLVQRGAGECITEQQAEPPEEMNTVWVYVDTSKRVGDLEYLKIFGRRDVADDWLALHDPKGVAHQYPIIGEPRMIRKPIP
jgi:hypothetical protein